MGVYEYWQNGELVDRVQLKPRGDEDTRVGLAALQREEIGARDGWYVAGTYSPEPAAEPVPGLEAPRAAARRRPASNKAEAPPPDDGKED